MKEIKCAFPRERQFHEEQCASQYIRVMHMNACGNSAFERLDMRVNLPVNI